MNSLFKEYEKNIKGRDFVVSDIHGCYTDLETALAGVSFDPAKDRLFSVGDLADRGPESKTAIAFIKNPWFHPVLGNHEEMFLKCWIERNEPIEWHCHNGGDWVRGLRFYEKKDYECSLSELPLIIRIGRVLICHSLLPHQPLETTVENIEKLRDFIIWQRDESFFGGPDGFTTYAGHTIHAEPVKYGNVIDIDTGGFLKHWGREGKLTIVDITGQE